MSGRGVGRQGGERGVGAEKAASGRGWDVAAEKETSGRGWDVGAEKGTSGRGAGPKEGERDVEWTGNIPLGRKVLRPSVGYRTCQS